MLMVRNEKEEKTLFMYVEPAEYYMHRETFHLKFLYGTSIYTNYWIRKGDPSVSRAFFYFLFF